MLKELTTPLTEHININKYCFTDFNKKYMRYGAKTKHIKRNNKQTTETHGFLVPLHMADNFLVISGVRSHLRESMKNKTKKYQKLA